MKPTARFYQIEGMSLPSVTSILAEFLPEGEALQRWKARTPDNERVMARSAAIGTLVHYRIAQYFSEKFHTPPVLLDLKGAAVDEEMVETVNLLMSYFEDVLRVHEPIPEKTEFTVWHRRALYAGSGDMLGHFDRLYTLLDWKTSSGIFPRHRAQAWAYKKALTSDPKFGRKIDQLAIVDMSAKHGLKVEIVDEAKAEAVWWEAFDAYQMAERPQDKWITREAL